jgi:hypothetical protein
LKTWRGLIARVMLLAIFAGIFALFAWATTVSFALYALVACLVCALIMMIAFCYIDLVIAW